MQRTVLATAVLSSLALASAALVAGDARATADARGRTTELPTEWRLSAPAADVTPTGTLPESTTLTGDGKHVVVTDAGAGPAQIQILDAASLRIERTIPMTGVYGVPLSDPTGAGFWVSTAAQATIVHIDAATGVTDRTVALPAKSWASSIARSPDGTTLAVSDESGDRVHFIDLTANAPSGGTPAKVPQVVSTSPFGAHLADAVYAADGKSLYVANWGGSSIFVIDAVRHSVRSEIPTGKHPEHLLLAPDGARLYASEPDDDDVAVIDTARAALVATLPVGLYGGALSGTSPTSLALDATGTRLYVTLSAANAVVALAPLGLGGDPARTFVGALPTGWYPTSVTVDPAANALIVADGMGESGRANPQFHPFEKRSAANTGYIAASMVGSIRRIAVPSDAELATGIAEVLENGGPFLRRALADDAVRARGPLLAGRGATILRPGGPIRHVIYVIKENRTYDQVLGDLPAADGDPALTLFGRAITPNEHALAERFGIFDRTFANAEVSADGHNWSTAAFADDYLEKMWPPGYAGRRSTYDFEDGATASVPHAGYLWNLAKRSGVTLQNFGEFTTEPNERQPVVGETAATVHTGITSSMPDLAEETDPEFVGFDLAVSDLTRVARWQTVYAAESAAGTVPSIQILRLPNDHTAGTRPGELTPAAYVAQNDDAVGRLASIVSHGKEWSSTAIFVLEDDAQNGADHVDAQRMTFYLISPYAAGGVQHAHYTTAGVLRTIEMIFGMPPMTAYDAAARPLTAAFTDRPQLAFYDVLPERQSETATTGATAYHARENLRYDLAHEDAFPSAEMNDEIWHARTGHGAPAR